MDELKKYHVVIKDNISTFFDTSKTSLITKESDVLIYEFLKEYSLRGKLIRGSLVLLINEALQGKFSSDALITATALEVLHSSILVIDDIIDKDLTRRSKPSMHVVVRELIPLSLDLEHDAQSIAQCVGLIGTYSSYGLLSKVNVSVIETISSEFTKTGFAELNEIILAQKSEVLEEDVMNIYKFKTAKYTITLPFKLAYILSNETFTKELENITDNIGILFQIRDDLLELEQDAESIGKSNTSDIRAGKEHYPRKLLEKLASPKDLAEINDAYKLLDDSSVKLIQDMYKKYDVVGKTNAYIEKIKLETINLIEEQDSRVKPILLGLLNYVVSRKY